MTLKLTKPSEQSEQINVCEYLKYQHHNVLFTCDLASGIKLSKNKAVMAKKMRSSKGWPDIYIAEPRGTFHGLYIEMKREGERIYKQNGEPASDHIADQLKMHKKLQDRGYMVYFAIGFEQAVNLIDAYLGVK